MKKLNPSEPKFDFIIRDNVKTHLIELRIEHGLTQTDVGKITGKSKNAVGSWEQGLSLPDIQTLARLAAYYRKTLEYMCGLENEEKHDH